MTVQILQKVLFFCIIRYSNFQFSATTNSIPSIKISIENTGLVDKYSTKKFIVFTTCIKFLIVRKFQRKPFNFSRCSNSYFTKTTDCSFFYQGRHRKLFLLVEIYSMEELSICVSCIRVLKVRKF